MSTNTSANMWPLLYIEPSPEHEQLRRYSRSARSFQLKGEGESPRADPDVRTLHQKTEDRDYEEQGVNEFTVQQSCAMHGISQHT